MTASAAGGCFLGSVREDATREFEVVVPSMAEGEALFVAVINNQYSATGGWDPAAFTLTTASRLSLRSPGVDASIDPAPPGQPFINMATGGPPDSRSFGVYTGSAGGCAGTYTVVFDNPGGNDDTEFLLAYALADADSELAQWISGTPWLDDAAVTTSGTPTYVSKRILLGYLGGAQQFVIPINAPWSNEGYLARSVRVEVKADEFSAFHDSGYSWDVDLVGRSATSPLHSVAWTPAYQGNLWNGDGGYSDPSTTNDNSNAFRAFKGIAPRADAGAEPSWQGVGARVTIPSLSTFDYDWSRDLYMDLTVTVTWSEYPGPGAGALDVQATPGGDPREGGVDQGDPLQPAYIEERIYMMSLTSTLWSRVTASVTGAEGAPDISFGTSLLGATTANAGQGFGLTPDTVANSARNDALYQSLVTYVSDVRAPISTGKLTFLGPNGAPLVPKLFIKVRRGACNDADVSWTGLSVNVEYVTGECQSYKDCFAPEDDHPSDTSGRLDLSAVGDADRFVHCLLTMEGTGTPQLAFKTVCSECSRDCDCPGGNYCHLDAGLCDRTAGTPDPNTELWQCDDWSAARFGTCQPKNALGQRCRPGVTSATPGTVGYIGDQDAWTASRSWLNTVSSLGVYVPSTDDDGGAVDPTGDDFDPNDDNNNGYGFCGGARYWNASNTVPGAAAVAYSARTTLWQGFCYNFECRECTEFASGSCPGRTCLDGRFVDTIVMDGTPRTYTRNAVAGTLLGLTFMVILLQLILVGHFVYVRCGGGGKSDKGAQMQQNPAAGIAASGAVTA